MDAVADITKLLVIARPEYMNNLKSYCELRYFIILHLKTGMDEGNFNLASNLFRNILPLYLIHLCSKLLLGPRTCKSVLALVL